MQVRNKERKLRKSLRYLHYFLLFYKTAYYEQLALIGSRIYTLNLVKCQLRAGNFWNNSKKSEI